MEKDRYKQLVYLKISYASLVNEMLRMRGIGFETPPAFKKREAEIRELIVQETAEVLLESLFRYRWLRYIYRPMTQKIIRMYYKKVGITTYGRAEK